MEQYHVCEDNGGGLTIYSIADGEVVLAQDETGCLYTPDGDECPTGCITLQEGYDHSENKIIAELDGGDWDDEIIATYPERAGYAGKDWLRARGIEIAQ